jgi:hypothetical protein
VLCPEGPRRHEKNWMPRVKPAPADAGGDALHFIYLCDPTRLVDDQARTVAETTPSIAANLFRGGSQAIALDRGWLALIHEVLWVEPVESRRYYRHRFVWFDEANTLRRARSSMKYQPPSASRGQNSTSVSCSSAEAFGGSHIQVAGGLGYNTMGLHFRSTLHVAGFRVCESKIRILRP